MHNEILAVRHGCVIPGEARTRVETTQKRGQANRAKSGPGASWFQSRVMMMVVFCLHWDLTNYQDHVVFCLHFKLICTMLSDTCALYPVCRLTKLLILPGLHSFLPFSFFFSLSRAFGLSPAKRQGLATRQEISYVGVVGLTEVLEKMWRVDVPGLAEGLEETSNYNEQWAAAERLEIGSILSTCRSALCSPASILINFNKL